MMSDDGSLDPQYVAQAGAAVATGTLISCACADLTKGAAATSFAIAVQEAGPLPGRDLLGRGLRRTNATISVIKSSALMSRGQGGRGLRRSITRD